jgi:hypothetical protein
LKPPRATHSSLIFPLTPLAPIGRRRQVGEHVAAIDAVLRDLSPHVGRLPDNGASALAVLETALERSATAVEKCRGMGALGAMWHARDLKEEFQDAQQARD